jgi:uncharacterized protein (DUF362 family)
MPMTMVDFTDYETSVAEALDAVGAPHTFARQETILVKPNLVNASPHPVTTPPACVEAIIRYIRRCSRADIVIAEGCGDPAIDTAGVFEQLGYGDLARRSGATLVDLNRQPCRRLERREDPVFPEFYLPECAFSAMVVSVPVLKAHSLAGITGTLKNMMGFAPPSVYRGNGFWNKAAFHSRLHAAIVSLNRYRQPDLTVMDASVGLAEHHLGGRSCDPPVGKILSGTDPWRLDRRAAGLLGLDWTAIGHLAMA